MTYILEELLNIRHHREQAALNLVLRAKREVREARLLAEKRDKELSGYIEWRQREEQRLFEKVRRRSRKIHHLRYFNQCIEHMREKQTLLAELLRKAEQAVLLAEKNLEEAKKRYARLYREKRKLEEHKASWVQEERLRDEVLAENELDEFNTARCFS